VGTVKVFPPANARITRVLRDPQGVITDDPWNQTWKSALEYVVRDPQDFGRTKVLHTVIPTHFVLLGDNRWTVDAANAIDAVVCMECLRKSVPQASVLAWTS